MKAPAILALLVLGFFASVMLIAFLRTRDLTHPLLSLLRVFVPSWRFFDDPQGTTRLFYRIVSDEFKSGWQSLPKHPRRHWGQLFLNPYGNLALAEQSLVESLMMDLQKEPRPTGQSVLQNAAYQRVVHLIRFEVRKVFPYREGVRFQFKIDIESRGHFQEGLLSLDHELDT